MAQTPSERIATLGLILPEAPAPVAAYVPFVRTGSLVIISGQIPLRDGALLATGTVPGQVDPETAIACARQCALNALAVAADAAGGLDRIARVLRLGCFVASEPGFTDQARIANGASELVGEIFGDAGRHARAAVGSIALPLGAPVEIEMMVELA